MCITFDYMVNLYLHIYHDIGPVVSGFMIVINTHCLCQWTFVVCCHWRQTLMSLINVHGYFNQSFFHSFSACFSLTGPFSCMWSVRDVLPFPSDCCHLPRGWNLFVHLLKICLSYLKPAWFLTCHFQWVFYFGVSATAASQWPCWKHSRWCC